LPHKRRIKFLGLGGARARRGAVGGGPARLSMLILSNPHPNNLPHGVSWEKFARGGPAAGWMEYSGHGGRIWIPAPRGSCGRGGKGGRLSIEKKPPSGGHLPGWLGLWEMPPIGPKIRSVGQIAGPGGSMISRFPAGFPEVSGATGVFSAGPSPEGERGGGRGWGVPTLSANPALAKSPGHRPGISDCSCTFYWIPMPQNS